MKKYKKFVRALCVFVTAILCLYLCLSEPLVQSVITRSEPHLEEYLLWKEYSMQVAKTLNTESIADEEVEASYEIKNNKIFIRIDSLKYGITFKSMYPISVNAKDGKVEIQANCEDGEYKEYYFSEESMFSRNKTLTVIMLLLTTCFVSIIAYGILYAIIYGIPKFIWDCRKENKSNKKQN